MQQNFKIYIEKCPSQSGSPERYYNVVRNSWKNKQQ